MLRETARVCVFITTVPITKLFARCVFITAVPVCVCVYCVFITAVPITKLFACVFMCLRVCLLLQYLT